MAGRPHSRSERSLHGPLQAFDLEVEAARLREENERREGRRNSITLHKGGGLNVMLLAMKAGDWLEEHSAPGPIALSVREGRIRFTAKGEAALEAGNDARVRRRGTPRRGGPERRRVPNQRGDRRVSLEEHERSATTLRTDFEAVAALATGREGVV